MKTVTITFNGPSMSGKKAMAELLRSLLTASRFQVETEDTSYGSKSAGDVAATLARLNRENTRVVIKFSSESEVAATVEDDNAAW